jgi:asparagine synthase (glutamine-hydrolysing)
VCGIAGLVDLSGRPVDRALLLSMLRRIAHRGPDGGGWMEDVDGSIQEGPRDSSRATASFRFTPARAGEASVALGHQRLAITDLSDAGRQPMSRGGGRWWIVFNGAIYNAREIREELEALGDRFTSATDTEVLLAAWIRWGPGALPRLNGMWSFAVWDARERELVCCRDRFGIKPFFHTSLGSVFAFASEPKALRVIRPATPNLELVADYLAVGSYLTGDTRTSFADYSLLPAGCLLRAGARGIRVERWYDLDERVGPDTFRGDFDEAAGQVRDLLSDSIALRLRADVPVGLLLSGGVDSSGIAGLIAAHHRTEFSGRTISLRYRGRSDIDESAYSDAVLEMTGFSGVDVEPTPADFDRELDAMIETADNFVFSSVFYAQRRLYQRAREAGLPVMLAGQGSDELFGGYEPWDVHVAQLWNRGDRLAAVTEGLLSGNRQWGPIRGLRHTVGVLRASRRPRACRCSPDGNLQEHQRHLLLLDYLPALIEHEDKNSMAFGIECRLPFLDYRLVEFVRTLPGTFLCRRGWTKAVLRAALAPYLPEKVRRRPRKLGLPGPLDGQRPADVERAEAARRRLLDSPCIPREMVPGEEAAAEKAIGLRVRIVDAWVRRCLDAPADVTRSSLEPAASALG